MAHNFFSYGIESLALSKALKVRAIYYQTLELIHFGVASREAVQVVALLVKVNHSCVAFTYIVFHVFPSNKYLSICK